MVKRWQKCEIGQLSIGQMLKSHFCHLLALESSTWQVTWSATRFAIAFESHRSSTNPTAFRLCVRDVNHRVASVKYQQGSLPITYPRRQSLSRIYQVPIRQPSDHMSETSITESHLRDLQYMSYIIRQIACYYCICPATILSRVVDSCSVHGMYEKPSPTLE